MRELSYCENPFIYRRRKTREVKVGNVGVGGRVGLGATLLAGPVPGLAFDVGAGIAEVGGRASPSLSLLIGVQFGG